MPTDVVMPQMGESIFEGTITKWLKKAGDAVEKDEPLFEISTDKVDAEIPSPVAGVLTEIKIAEGSTVGINTVVAVVTESGEEQGTGNRDQGSAVAVPALMTAQAASGPACGGTEVVMPQMGESIFEGTITKWLKKAGDHVEKDEPLFEISTDKVDAEIPSPVAGVLTEIKIGEGATVQINTVVALIGGASSGADASTGAAPTQAAAFPTPTPMQSALAPAPGPAPQASNGAPVRFSPLVRRIAKENNLDLGRVASLAGSGAGGRITKEDVLKHLSENRPGSAAVQTSATPTAPA